MNGSKFRGWNITLNDGKGSLTSKRCNKFISLSLSQVTLPSRTDNIFLIIWTRYCCIFWLSQELEFFLNVVH